MTLEGNWTFSCQLVPGLVQREGGKQKTLARGLATHAFNLSACEFNWTWPRSVKEQFSKEKARGVYLFLLSYSFTRKVLVVD